MRGRRFISAAAVLIVTPAFVVAPSVTGAVTGVADTAPQPVSSTEASTDLLPPDAAAVGDGDVTSRRDLRLAAGQAAKSGLPAKGQRVLEVTAPQPVPSDVAVAGVTWSHGTGSAVVVQYRSQGRNGWGKWQSVDADASRAPDRNESASRSGSDPIILTGARQVQVRVLGPSGGTPADAKLTVVDPGEAAQDATVGTAQPGAATAAGARPTIYSRARWGADETIRRAAPSYAQIRAVVVHHTAGTNNYVPSQVPRILRGIYAYHVKTRGWNDIGYNFLVDKWGRIWEGRAGGAQAAVSGAHTVGLNSVSMGVSVMGNYSVAQTPAATVRALSRVIGWKSGIHKFPLLGRVTLFGKRYPRVMGHRDAAQTDCPGRYLYAKLPTIRRLAVSYRG